MAFKYFALIVTIAVFVQSAAGVPAQSREGDVNAEENVLVNREDSAETNDVNTFINKQFNTQTEIEIPDFREGQSRRFIHDFNTNKTVIVDTSTERCFMMDLDYDIYPPPSSLFDLFQKGLNGEYNVDTTVVRQTMRVVLPPINIEQTHGSYIYNDCNSYTTYLLERIDRPVITNRSTRSAGTIFTEYTGINILEFDIINMDDVFVYQK